MTSFSMHSDSLKVWSVISSVCSNSESTSTSVLCSPARLFLRDIFAHSKNLIVSKSCKIWRNLRCYNVIYKSSKSLVLSWFLGNFIWYIGTASTTQTANSTSKYIMHILFQLYLIVQECIKHFQDTGNVVSIEATQSTRSTLVRFVFNCLNQDWSRAWGVGCNTSKRTKVYSSKCKHDEGQDWSTKGEHFNFHQLI